MTDDFLPVRGFQVDSGGVLPFFILNFTRYRPERPLDLTTYFDPQNPLQRRSKAYVARWSDRYRLKACGILRT